MPIRPVRSKDFKIAPFKSNRQNRDSICNFCTFFFQGDSIEIYLLKNCIESNRNHLCQLLPNFWEKYKYKQKSYLLQIFLNDLICDLMFCEHFLWRFELRFYWFEKSSWWFDWNHFWSIWIQVWYQYTVCTKNCQNFQKHQSNLFHSIALFYLYSLWLVVMEAQFQQDWEKLMHWISTIVDLIFMYCECVIYPFFKFP